MLAPANAGVAIAPATMAMLTILSQDLHWNQLSLSKMELLVLAAVESNVGRVVAGVSYNCVALLAAMAD